MHAAIDEHKYDFETIEMNYPGRVGGSLCIFISQVISMGILAESRNFAEKMIQRRKML